MSNITGGQNIQVGPIAIRFLLEAQQTGGLMTMFEFTVPPEARVPVAHSHEAFDETIYGLEGALSWTVDGERAEVAAGGVLFIRRGVVHHFENRAARVAKMLSVITPGLLGPDYFHDIAQAVDAAAGGPPDVARIMAVMQRHGLRPAGR